MGFWPVLCIIRIIIYYLYYVLILLRNLILIAVSLDPRVCRSCYRICAPAHRTPRCSPAPRAPQAPHCPPCPLWLYRRTTPGQEAAPAVAAACLRACVRCRACVSCAARPLTSGCIVIVWSRVCVESCVRCAGARRCSSTSSYATYKVLTVGKVYRPSRTSSLHRRRSRDEAAPGLILIADSAQRWNLFRRAVMRCAFDRRSHSAS